MTAPALYRHTVVLVRRYNGGRIESCAAVVEAPDGLTAAARAIDRVTPIAERDHPRPGASAWWCAFAVLGTAVDATGSLGGHLGTLYRDPIGVAP